MTEGALDRRPAHPVFPRERGHADPAGRVPGANPGLVGGVQLEVAALAPLGVAVTGIIEGRPQKQMIWTDAATVVAVVADLHPVGNWAVRQFPGEAVGGDRVASYPEPPVPVVVHCPVAIFPASGASAVEAAQALRGAGQTGGTKDDQSALVAAVLLLPIVSADREGLAALWAHGEFDTLSGHRVLPHSVSRPRLRQQRGGFVSHQVYQGAAAAPSVGAGVP